MYRCEICNRVSEPREPAHRVVLETRFTTYSARRKVNACYKQFKHGKKFVHTDDPGGCGYEIAREVIACAGCAQRLRDMHERLAPFRPRETKPAYVRSNHRPVKRIVARAVRR